MWHAEDLLTSLYRASQSNREQHDAEMDELIIGCTNAIEAIDLNASIEEWTQFLTTASNTEKWADSNSNSKFNRLHSYMSSVQQEKPAFYKDVYQYLFDYVENEKINISQLKLSRLQESCKQAIESIHDASIEEWEQFLTTARNTVLWKTVYAEEALDTSKFKSLVAYMRDLQVQNFKYYKYVRNHLLMSVQNKTIALIEMGADVTGRF